MSYELMTLDISREYITHEAFTTSNFILAANADRR